LEKYPELGVPNRIHNEFIKDTILIRNTGNLYKTPTGNTLKEVVNGYIKFSFPLSIYLIMWRNKNELYMDKNLKLHLKHLIDNPKIKFILFKLTLVPSSHGTHANIFLFDKKNETLERFDPYGAIPYLNKDDMDNFFEEKFREIFDSYKNFVYLRPDDFMGNISFQLLSNDGDIDVKKLGDPIGYCLAWTFWYIEMRLSNEIAPVELVRLSVKKIKEGIKKGSKNPFIDFIRNYASHLNLEKDKILKSFGIKSANHYDIIQNDDIEEKINKSANDRLNIIFKRFRS
jgi:hypothetical protein